MRLQANILGMIILVGIFIGLLGFAYQGVMPVIQKNEAVGKFQQAKAWVQEAAKGMVEIANEGGKRDWFFSTGSLRLSNCSSDNCIFLIIPSQAQINEIEAKAYFPEIQDEVTPGRYGEDDPWVFLYEPEGMTLKLCFRKLSAQDRNYTIALLGEEKSGKTLKVEFWNVTQKDGEYITYLKVEIE